MGLLAKYRKIKTNKLSKHTYFNLDTSYSRAYFYAVFEIFIVIAFA